MIPDLLKIVIIGKRLAYPMVSHHNKRRAVRETEGFVSVPFEHLPGVLFPGRCHADDRDQAARADFFPKFDSDVMPCTMAQQGLGLIEHEIACHVADACGQQGPVERCRCLPERIAFVLERYPTIRIHEDLSHGFRAP